MVERELSDVKSLLVIVQQQLEAVCSVSSDVCCVSECFYCFFLLELCIKESKLCLRTTPSYRG